MELMAEESKKEGNEAMKKEKYFEAVLYYTKGIKLDPHNAHIYSNRSAAFLKIQQHYHALDDAETVIRILPRWAKGYYRKGEVLCAAEHYELAVNNYKKGLTAVPDDPVLQVCLKNAMDQWKQQRKVEGRIPWFGVTFGAVIGILLIICDEFISHEPILKNDLFRSGSVIALIILCYCIAVLYRYFLRSQRGSLLDPPIDLLNEKEGEELLSRACSNSSAKSSHDSASSKENIKSVNSQGAKNKKKN